MLHSEATPICGLLKSSFLNPVGRASPYWVPVRFRLHFELYFRSSTIIFPCLNPCEKANVAQTYSHLGRRLGHFVAEILPERTPTDPKKYLC